MNKGARPPHTGLCSVLIPAYNCEDYIKESVHSILSQTYQNLEIIIVDDGSEDNTGNIVQSIGDTRIKYYRNSENLGLIRTLNLGLQYCSGDFIARMDADDISLQTRIEKQISLLSSRPEIDICGCFLEYFGSMHGGARTAKDWKEAQVRTIFTTPIFHATIVFRRRLFDDGIFSYDPEFLAAEDYDLWERLCLGHKIKFASIPEALFRYRIHPGGACQVHSDIQNVHANVVRVRQLLRLKPTASDEYQNRYLSFVLKPTKNITLRDYSFYAAMVDELIELNAEQKVYPLSLYVNHMRYRLFRHGLELVSAGGVKSFIHIIKNPYFIRYPHRFVKLLAYLIMSKNEK